MKYYSEHSKEYIDNTKDANMTNLYSFFEKYLPTNSKSILDIGFGSGRDSLYFTSKGLKVLSIDPTPEFCEYGTSIGLNVECKKAEEIDYCNEFDGIWACASLLHVNSSNLNDVFKRCYKALTHNGVMYCSFKYGTFDGFRNDRHFVDVDEDRIKEFISDTGFILKETMITFDVRPGRDDKWLNIILKKRKDVIYGT